MGLESIYAKTKIVFQLPLLISVALLTNENAYGAELHFDLGQITFQPSQHDRLSHHQLPPQKIYDAWDLNFNELGALAFYVFEFEELQDEITWEYLFLKNFESSLQIALPQNTSNNVAFNNVVFNNVALKNPLASITPLGIGNLSLSQQTPSQLSIPVKAENNNQGALTEKVSGGSNAAVFSQLANALTQLNFNIDSPTSDTNVAVLPQTTFAEINLGLYAFDSSQSSSPPNRPRPASGITQNPNRQGNRLLQAQGPIGFGTGIKNTFGRPGVGSYSSGVRAPVAVGVSPPFNGRGGIRRNGVRSSSPIGRPLQLRNTVSGTSISNRRSNANRGDVLAPSSSIPVSAGLRSSPLGGSSLGIPPRGITPFSPSPQQRLGSLGLGTVGNGNQPAPLSNPLPGSELTTSDDLEQLGQGNNITPLPLSLAAVTDILGELRINTSFSLTPNLELNTIIQSTGFQFLLEQPISNTLVAFGVGEGEGSLFSSQLSEETQQLAQEQREQFLKTQEKIEEKQQKRIEEEQQRTEERLEKLQRQVEKRIKQEEKRQEKRQKEREKRREQELRQSEQRLERVRQQQLNNERANNNLLRL